MKLKDVTHIEAPASPVTLANGRCYHCGHVAGKPCICESCENHKAASIEGWMAEHYGTEDEICLEDEITGRRRKLRQQPTPPEESSALAFYACGECGQQHLMVPPALSVEPSKLALEAEARIWNAINAGIEGR
jgi:hypothetical protein